MDEPRTIKLGVEMPEEMRRQVKTEAARRGVKMKDAVFEAFDAWLTGSRSKKADYRGWEPVAESTPSAVPQPIYGKAGIELPPHLAAELLSAGNRKRLEMLAGILKSGNADAIRLATESLEVFAEFAQIKGETPPPARKARRPEK